MLKDALSRMADVFLPIVLMRGQEYQQQGFVLNIRLSDGLLKARVKGRSSQIYDVHIDLKTWPAKPARCACSRSTNCKHAAASLLALQVKENIAMPIFKNQAPDQSLASWLQTLQKTPTVKVLQEKTHDMVYLLKPCLERHEHRVLVSLALAKRLKRGGIGKKIIFNSIPESRRQFFTDSDSNIVNALLLPINANNWSNPLVLRNSDLLVQILQTNRAYLADEDEPLICLATNSLVRWRWQLNLDGTQHLVLKLNDTIVQPLLLDTLWYYDALTTQFCQLATSYRLDDLKTLLTLAPVALEQVPATIAAMQHMAPDLPRPTIYQHRQQQQLTPTPVLCFDAIELKSLDDDASQTYYAINKPFLFISQLYFDYGHLRIKATESLAYLAFDKQQTLIQLVRDELFEQQKQSEYGHYLASRKATITEQTDLALTSLADILINYRYEHDLIQLHQHVIPQLKTNDWRIEFNHSVYDEIVTADELEWFSDLQERGQDFFAYQLGILVDGKPVSIVPLVASLIAKLTTISLDDLADNARVVLPLPDGKRLHVHMARIKPLISFLLQYGTANINDAQQLDINRYQLLLIQETEQALAASALRWQGGALLRQQLQQLVTQQGFESVTVPQGLQATLRDYQYQGLNWLQFLRKNQFGGILADDMGLGKTIQTLAHLQLEKEQGRLTQASLIVAPTSLVANWYEEAQRFVPDLGVLIFHGSERHQDEFGHYDVVVSTYGLIQRDKSRFIDYSFYYLILDEAQCIKNARAKTTQIIQQIRARHRLCLSGTPMENHLGELWSLFHFLMPGLLGDNKQFRQFFKTPIEKNGDSERQALLAKRVKPFMLRRTKNQVASELPAKTEITHMIELTGTQRDLYEAIRMSMEKKVRDAIAQLGMGQSHIVLLDALLKLRQVCCDPRLLSIPAANVAHGTSAKLEALMTLIDSLVAENRRVLVFSQFTSMLKIIEERLISRAYDYLKLTGSTQNRQQLVNKFQEGHTPIFLISLKAGGTGLNLTRADTVIHYDPWWNPAAEDQATDRSHRIGQENPVFVYKLITSGTVEEAILAMQAKKRQLFDGILSEDGMNIVGITANDIEQFFQPLVDAF